MAEIKQPKIRFKGHIDDWEQRKLYEHTELITKGTTPKDKSNTGDVTFIKVENLSNGKINSNSKISDLEHNNYLKRSILKEDDILFSIAGTLGKTAIVDKSILPANTNQALSIIRGYDFDKNFLITSLEGSVVSEYIRKNPTIGAQPNLSLEQVKNLCINTPNKDEQLKIGEFFKTLDDTIALHQQKLEVTKQFKQTMLKKMFPKNGETTPEIRFKGFTEDWEECKLKDLCSLSTGKLDANAMTTDGKYSFFTSGEKVYKTDTFAFDGDAILIAGNGNVGLQHTYSGKFNAYQRTYVLMDFKINKEILSNQITLELPKVLKRETRVGVIPYIVKDMLTELPINYPRNVREQKSISEYFNTLNSNIFNIECRLESLLNLKQTMLKKLFI